MINMQFVLGFILGLCAAVLIIALAAPMIRRRVLYLTRAALRTEMPQSLKEAEADRDFLRAKNAAGIAHLQQRLEKERQQDYERKLALSKARELLASADALAARCKAQQAELEKQREYILKLEERGRKDRQKAAVALQMKRADLQNFRKQIKLIAAQTAAMVAAHEGEHSPVWHFVGSEEDFADKNTGKAAKTGIAGKMGGTFKTAQKSLAAETLADAIYRQAKRAGAMLKKTRQGESSAESRRQKS